MLLLTSLREVTGIVNAARLAELIPAAHCSLMDINALPDAKALRDHVCECYIRLVLGIHARAGRLLVGCGVPFAIVLGGTDMNVMLHDEPKRRVVLDAIAQAGAVIAFNGELLGRLLEAMPEAKPKTFFVPQVVCTSLASLGAAGGDVGTVGGLGAAEAQELRRWLELEADDVLLLLLPAGLGRSRTYSSARARSQRGTRASRGSACASLGRSSTPRMPRRCVRRCGSWARRAASRTWARCRSASYTRPCGRRAWCSARACATRCSRQC
mmetsp:Transcript_13519/g.31930  ORF Transcript_13519/g.31930 Transcript_13519/m.31930 type:complete len:269 (-) Transcript_13519:295-1101(-)